MELLERVRRAASRIDGSRADRDQAIIDALNEGFPVTEIAKAAQLSRQAIYDILERTSR